MTKVFNFEDYVAEHTPHCTAELICINCKERWIGVWPEQVPLKDLSCPYCRQRGFIITTGQFLPDDLEE